MEHFLAKKQRQILILEKFNAIFILEDQPIDLSWFSLAKVASSSLQAKNSKAMEYKTWKLHYFKVQPNFHFNQELFVVLKVLVFTAKVIDEKKIHIHHPT